MTPDCSADKFPLQRRRLDRRDGRFVVAQRGVDFLGIAPQAVEPLHHVITQAAEFFGQRGELPQSVKRLRILPPRPLLQGARFDLVGHPLCQDRCRAGFSKSGGER